MHDASPWDDIDIPNADFNVRQVASKAVATCFWGRDRSGACLFIVELEGNHTQQYQKSYVTVHGINVDLRDRGANLQSLVLTLEKQVDQDLFEGLCRTLVVALERAADSASSLTIALSHIRRWKTFLSGRGQHMSIEEVRGLFAELTFLQELLDWPVPDAIAIEAWLGPEKSHQDFIYRNIAVEIKSLSGAERSTVRISSEDQLESLNESLFLRIYRLSSLADAKGAQSLNALVTDILGRLAQADAIEAFERKLVAYGYAPLPIYDEPVFVIGKVVTYRVQQSFPRLVRSRLSTGLTSVTYDIKLEAITSYECDNSAVFGGG
jgi:Putative  PD-(D/E)XK family member, (DUF4420)